MAGALESVAAAQDDQLIPGLNFKLPAGASYVSGRRFATFFPQGSNIYSPTGTRLVRFVLSDATNYLDLSTFRLAFQITNGDGTNPISPTGHPGQCWFQRVRIYVGGCLVEDILYANRVSGMLQLMKPAQRRWSEALELLGQTNDATATNWSSTFLAGPTNAVIPANQTQTIITPIFAGLFSTHYLLPGRFPLTIELELVSSASQCCAAKTIAGANASQNFSMQNVRILCDVVTCDNAVNEELSKVLLAGGALPMHLTSYSTTMHNLILNPPAVGANIPAGATSQSWAVTLSRAFSRIKDIWITFESDGAYSNNGTQTNTFLNWHGKADWTKYNTGNTYLPANGEGWRFQMTSGSLIFPDLPMQSSQEAWYQLSKVLGLHSSLDGVSITPAEWLATQFVIALDMEKMSSSPGAGMAAFTGLSTRNAGDTLRFAFENVNPRINPAVDPAKVGDVNAWPTRMYVTLHMDLVLEMRAEGCVLLD